jgi:hypothetical protein
VPVRQCAAAAWPPRATPTARFKALSGQRRVPTVPRTPRPRASLRLARRPTAPRARHRVPTASPAPPTAASRAPPPPRPAVSARPLSEPSRRRARPSPVAVTPRRRLRAGEPPPPRRLRAPVSSRRLSLSSAAAHYAACAVRRARRPAETELGQRRACGPRALRPTEAAPVWPWAAHALCAWAEPTPRACSTRHCASGFRPRDTQIDFLFSEYIQFLANSKICVGFI